MRFQIFHPGPEGDRGRVFLGATAAFVEFWARMYQRLVVCALHCQKCVLTMDWTILHTGVLSADCLSLCVLEHLCRVGSTISSGKQTHLSSVQLVVVFSIMSDVLTGKGGFAKTKGAGWKETC